MTALTPIPPTRRRAFGWRSLLDRARALVDATDRWFVSLSHGLAAPRDRTPAEPPSPRTIIGPSTSPRVDLLTGERPPTVAADVEATPAGVAPLLRALGQLVLDHRATGYRSLQFDDRFWGLLELLQALTGRRPPPEAGASDDPLPSVSQISQGARS